LAVKAPCGGLAEPIPRYADIVIKTIQPLQDAHRARF